MRQDPSRIGKIALIAELLRECSEEEIPVVVGLLTGTLRQGKIGVGWSGISLSSGNFAPSTTLQVIELDDRLTEIQKTTGGGSASLRSEQLRRLFEKLTSDDAEFVRRAILGDMRHGALAGVMVEAIASATNVPVSLLRRAAMLSGDLGVAAKAAVRGEGALRKVGLTVLNPISPMLASSSSDVRDAIQQTGKALVEWKLDGIRVQIHRSGDRVRIFTRNLNDITLRMPSLVKAVLGFPSPKFVIDGESLDKVYIFDCLHKDDIDLIDLPLLDRLDALSFVPIEMRIPFVITSDGREAARVYEEAIAAHHEGVVVKAIDSKYEAGRRGKAWLKVKQSRTLDLVVLGAEWGSGRREGWLSNLHLGAVDSSGEYRMVGKTFKGLTDEMLAWQTQFLQDLETHRDGFTVFVEPKLVVEIAIDGAQISERYQGGVGLRFARVKQYRLDKTPDQCDTIETIRLIAEGGKSE